jgi:soluble lytic murein transglycosylase-like protein
MTPELVAYVYREAKANGVPRAIAEAVIWRESSWRPYAIHRNATSVDMGLMQVNSRTWAMLEKRYDHGVISWAYDPYQNARYGLRYLGALRTVLGDWEDALRAYNGGLGAVIRGAVPESSVWYERDVLSTAGM